MSSTSAYRASSTPTGARTPVVNATPLEVECCDGLSASTEVVWQQFLSNNPRLKSGYFHPEFFRAVTRVRNDTELALIHNNGQLTGILPFQRVGARTAHPVGGMMNDFHGVIGESADDFNMQDTLQKANLRRFDFHALCCPDRERSSAVSSSNTKFVFRKLESPYIDLSTGLFDYTSWLGDHSSTVRRQGQKTRRMTRELGPVRLEFDCRDPQVLEQLIRWKREKFYRTRTFDLLSVDWTSNLLREIFSTRVPGFRGLLSGLWAGDQLVAAHFGFQCGPVLHYWFPAYDHERRRYSPGTQLMQQVIHSCVEHSIDRIDLGYGQSDLKDRFANNRTTVEVGCFGLSSVSRSLGYRRYQMRQLMKRAPMKEALKRVIRPLHPNFGQSQFR